MSLARKTLIGLASHISGRAFLILAFIALIVGLPGTAAASAEAVDLVFTDSDKIYLNISLGFGAIALVVGFLIRAKVMSMPKGNEKMQEVGDAIKAGALAYLSQQVRTMMIFVGIIAVGLFFMYNGKAGYEGMLPTWVAVSFVGGVAASYIAGYVGMLMAVEANVRTAHAALESGKKSFETAFKAGAVAGLITVGMGLIGATLIFMLAGSDAMKLLIGFGFGGSLAALFMRVGGGIFTKAADVGADLVGKVEAGIPEDDPRNPATIADNVGDNVGDCAGMAADVFESYEVTLVAAIILGAATASIFDQETWMRLILFALMARGVGILASIAGIFMVKGSDDPEADPLKPISMGFKVSAGIAAALSFGLAYFMMGGNGNEIETTTLKSSQASQLFEARTIIEARNRIAEEDELDMFEVTPEMILEDEAVAGLEIPEDQQMTTVQQFMPFELDDVPNVDDLEGYSPIDYGNEDSILASFSTDAIPDPTNPLAARYVSFYDRFEDARLRILTIEFAQDPSGGTDPNAVIETRSMSYGPMDNIEDFRGQIEEANLGSLDTAAANLAALAAEPVDENEDGIPDEPFISPTTNITIIEEYSAELYADEDGHIVAVVSDKDGDLALHRLQGGSVAFYKADIDKMLNLYTQQQANVQVTMPQAQTVLPASAHHQAAEWWRFGICILFGIVMAFVFERLTDYYVSLNGRPVREVAGVATAGPAPMIITGFAYGKESSVFSVLAIVASLIAPILIFPEAVYGSYLLSFYGIALVGLGLLTTTGYILAMDTFGPISDNAQGIFEMSGAGKDNPKAARSVQLLDAAGNTTKALTKGFAIATAVVAAVALFHAYIEDAQLTTVGMSLDVPEIFLGLLIGGAAPFLFSAFAINAVGRAAFELINEVRAQFRNDPGIMAGTSKPDYGRCVAISTAAAQRELIGPGILAIAFPVLVAFGFAIGKEPTMINGVAYNLVGAQALGGFLVGAILSGQLMAVMLANSGGIWDNAKKLIEDGMHGGKGTDAHTASIVCDTVGDPFKDTAGPALNPLIKVMNLVALLLAPVVIQPYGDGTLITITVIAAAALAVAIWWSKRSGMSDALEAGKADAAKSPSIEIGAGNDSAMTKDTEKDKENN